MVRSIIFDLDGTICDTLPLCIKAFRKAIEPLIGNTLSETTITDTFGPTEEGTIRALIPNQYTQGIRSYLDSYRKLHDMCPKPFDGIIGILELLKDKGLHIALATGKGKESCFITLEYFGITDYFDVIKTGSQTGPIKTKRITEILNDYSIKKDEAIYIGDAPSDILSAREAGVSCFSALWGSVVDEVGVKRNSPDKIFYQVDDLKEHLISIIDSNLS